MENKFYTPKIDEFWYGQEYEKLINNKWKKFSCLLHGPILEEEPWSLEQQNLRIKYLDKDDVESFGFTSGPNPYQIEIFDAFIFSNPMFKLFINYNSHKVKITASFNEIDLFQGVIKNKSELKKLLIQLEIL